MASTKRSDGDGSLYQRHGANCPPAIEVAGKNGKPKHERLAHRCSGPWVGSVVVGWRDGKPVRKKVSAPTKSAAAAKVRKAIELADAGTLAAGPSLTVAKWMEHYLEEIAARKVRPSTLRGYRTSVTQYIVPLLGHHRLDKLRPEHVETAWHELVEVGAPLASDKDRKPLSPATANQAHRILSRALKIANRRGLVSRNVATLIDAPQPAPAEVEPYTLEEAKKILEAARELRLGSRWSAAFALGWRQGEALGITWADLNLDEGRYRVHRALSRVTGKGLVLGPVKSRAGDRDGALPEELIAQFKARRAQQRRERLAAGDKWVGNEWDLVFTTPLGLPIDPRADWQEWKDLIAAAGVRDARVHDARHTAATLLLAQGVDPRTLMDIFGWSQRAMVDRYTHVLEDMRRDAAMKMGSALWG
ncbi:tyrosine-type recombinase/integrase [Nocardioides sp. CPCC 205120]|uniref:tyrosine-type recombinase/integrase n=1 Tax=Nocardioides sp. CPCC 205120 TaxID=3406462 RepID=UPI003B504767